MIGLAYVCGTAIVLLAFVSFAVGEACVSEIVCEEWFGPFVVIGLMSSVTAPVSGYALFILVSKVRAHAA